MLPIDQPTNRPTSPAKCPFGYAPYFFVVTEQLEQLIRMDRDVLAPCTSLHATDSQHENIANMAWASATANLSDEWPLAGWAKLAKQRRRALQT